ncbi:hypothetical protein [Xanthomonas tesorieronis]|uniref:hypothetical protein n=1 Tax=Xanthomonas tesorieronis TaxID=3160839 RepID=UPI0035116C00
MSVLLLVLGACTAGEHTATAATATATTPTPVSAAKPGDTLQTLIQESGVRCTDAKAARGCTAGNLDAGDFYDVELSPDCGGDGFFAGVAEAKGVDVLNNVPTTGSDVQPRARFEQGQLVCIQGIARAGQNPHYYYVIAVPASSVAKCKGNALCNQYGDRPIQRTALGNGGACRIAASGTYAGDCAQGWVNASALDVFSNGM